MASTTLFAPQVRSVQPAFIYDKELGRTVKIYFSLSDYNEGLKNFKIKYTLIDPNISSSWGSNSIINNANEYLEVENIYTENGEYYFEIDFFSQDTEENVFKTLTLNQYYQMQLYLVDENGEESLPSQVTLIRPIAAINEIIIEQAGKNLLAFNKINGAIIYKDSSTIESIKNYYFTLEKEEGVIKYKYTSDMIYNTLGTQFSANIYDCFLPDGEYILTFYYTTLNDYNGSYSAEIKLGIDNNLEEIEFKNFIFENNLNAGALDLDFQINSENIQSVGKLIIQRTSEISNFLTWETVSTFVNLDIKNRIKYSDFNIEYGKIYRYRFIYESGEEKYIAQYLNKDKQLLEFIPEFEDIFLSNFDQQLAVRFNPNITNFKYISQESITNTLGGKFPIVRINGDTKYRQFTLSGTLSFEMDWRTDITPSFDSRNRNMSSWIREDNCSLFFNLSNFYNNIKSNLKNQYKNMKDVFEKRYRDLAISFLNDRKPKIFRSPTEGNMIVYLSNISFTPNKQLSRNVYDFSATVTEICELNLENLKKYNLIYDNKEKYELIYVFRAEKDIEYTEDNITYLVPYVSIENTIDGIPILYAQWEKMEV